MTSSEQTPGTPADRGSDDHILDDVADPIGTVTRAVWGLVLIRGILAVIFGLLALFAPVLTLYAIVFVFAAYALVEGVIQIVHAIRVRHRDRRWGWLLATGVIAVIAGIVAFVFPGAAGLVYGSFGLALIAFYSVMMGIAGFPAAASATDGGRKVLGYIVAGLSIVLGVVLAIILVAQPVLAIINLIWVVGVWAIIIGVTLIIAAIGARTRATGRRAPRSGSGAEPAQG
ncbi:hypothetical protein GCM10009840_17410 [Pseudolysinimonas kribbensis]|uniref:HdeD family acid-resistance protein n=1 Tax=Pseudolysinimonas kribbensis TaxID=433641 RepID=UPI0031DC01F5